MVNENDVYEWMARSDTMNEIRSAMPDDKARASEFLKAGIKYPLIKFLDTLEPEEQGSELIGFNLLCLLVNKSMSGIDWEKLADLIRLRE